MFNYLDEDTILYVNQEDYPKILDLIKRDLKQQKEEGVEKPSEGSILLSDIPISAPPYTKLEYKFCTVHSIPTTLDDGTKINIRLA